MRSAAPPLALALALVWIAACGEPRAVRVDIEVDEPTGRLCVLAHGAGELVFSQAYGDDGVPPAQGSLTFVAGARVDQRLRVTARRTRAARVRASDSGESGFAGGEGASLSLRLRRCHPRDAVLEAPEAHTIASLDELDARTRLAAVDADGDGRDELLLWDERMRLVDPEDSTTVQEVPLDDLPTDGSVAAIADLDGDCRLGAVLASTDGVRALQLGPGAIERRFGSAAHDAAVGDPLGADGTHLVIASADGLRVLPADDPEAVESVDGGSWHHARLAGLDGDGIDDIVAAGEAGTRVWLGSGSGPGAVRGALPASFEEVEGPIDVGDVDGDGAPDIAGAADGGVRIARNRGDGLLEDRTGDVPLGNGTPLERLAMADLDGDCKDDVLLLHADGTVEVWRARSALRWQRWPVEEDTALDATDADLDGDGARELVVLRADGELVRWGP